MMDRANIMFDAWIAFKLSFNWCSISENVELKGHERGN